jgi:hypothetical protein
MVVDPAESYFRWLDFGSFLLAVSFCCSRLASSLIEIAWRAASAALSTVSTMTGGFGGGVLGLIFSSPVLLNTTRLQQ